MRGPLPVPQVAQMPKTETISVHAKRTRKHTHKSAHTQPASVGGSREEMGHPPTTNTSSTLKRATTHETDKIKPNGPNCVLLIDRRLTSTRDNTPDAKARCLGTSRTHQRIDSARSCNNVRSCCSTDEILIRTLRIALWRTQEPRPRHGMPCQRQGT